jgi:hypothetical protein
MQTNRARLALSCAWPAIVVATIVLLPFLNTPFSNDDPIFLAEARHLLTDPLHPQAIDVVWARDIELRESQATPSNIAGAYVFVPTALAGCKEWVAHLTQIALLAVALWGTALLALRLGLSPRGATVAAVLSAAAPAVLGLAITAMPDIAVMAYAVWAMERTLAWRDDRKWHQGLAMLALLTLAGLTRLFAIGLLLPAGLFLWGGRDWKRFLPLAGVPVAYLLAAWVTADPLAPPSSVELGMLSFQWRTLAGNAGAYLIHWSLVAPLALPWLVLRPNRKLFAVGAALLLVIALSGAGWHALLVVPGALALCDILWDARQRDDRDQAALWAWLLPALLAVFYLHVAAKYIAPLVPATAVLIARKLPKTSLVVQRWLPMTTAAAGLVVSFWVMTATDALARGQRQAVQDLIVPRLQTGERTWFSGHWAFQWYAEQAGARPVVLTSVDGDVPRAGDIVVVSRVDVTPFQSEWIRKSVLYRASYDGSGRVMDSVAGAGFFSNEFGYLPWMWSDRESNVFEVWRLE